MDEIEGFAVVPRGCSRSLGSKNRSTRMVDREGLVGAMFDSEFAGSSESLNGVGCWGASDPFQPNQPVEDLKLVCQVLDGQHDAIGKVCDLIDGLPIRPIALTDIGCRIDAEDVKADLRSKLIGPSTILKQYRGDGTLRSFLLKSAINRQRSLARKERRRGARLKTHFNWVARPRYDGRGDAASTQIKHRNSAFSRCEIVQHVRDTVHVGLLQEYFGGGSVGAPIRMAGACKRGLLTCVQSLAGMHGFVLDELYQGQRVEVAYKRYRTSGLWTGNAIELELKAMYESLGTSALGVVEHGVECMIDFMDAVEESRCIARGRWVREEAPMLRELARCRTELGRVLRRRAA
jgi:hypothetical protein